MAGVTFNYHRVNLDGISRTETREAGADLAVGTVATLTSDKFQVAADAGDGRLYVIHRADHQGGGDVPAGDSAVGEYVDEGREIAMLGASGQTFEKDTPVKVVSGKIEAAAVDVDDIIGYAQDPVGALTADKLIRVRVRTWRKDTGE